MTRDELIARIEAGETGPELLCAIALLVRWRFDERGAPDPWRYWSIFRSALMQEQS